MLPKFNKNINKTYLKYKTKNNMTKNNTHQHIHLNQHKKKIRKNKIKNRNTFYLQTREKQLQNNLKQLIMKVLHYHLFKMIIKVNLISRKIGKRRKSILVRQILIQIKKYHILNILLTFICSLNPWGFIRSHWHIISKLMVLLTE